MKKVILSLSMLAATLFAANAQNQIVLWNAETGATDITGTPFNFGPQGSPQGTPVVGNPGPDEGLRVDTTENVITAFGSVSKQVAGVGGYYVGGYGNASFSAPDTGLPFGTNVTGSGGEMNNYFLNLEVKAAGATAPKIKIQLSSKDSTNVQGYILDLTKATGVATGDGFSIYSIALGAFSNTIGLYGDPINKAGHFMTKQYADSLFKIEFAVNVGTTKDGSGAVAFSMKNQWISNNKSQILANTSAAAAKIASTKLFPNPTSNGFTAEISLVKNASVNVIVSDMMGKQVATRAVSNGKAFVETAGLVAGMYTVTYVVDGTPAKTELVVVK